MNILIRDLFVRVIKRRMENEGRTAEDIINDYPKLTIENKNEILNAISS